MEILALSSSTLAQSPPDTLRSSEGEQHRLPFHTPEVDRASERKIDLIGRPS